MVRISEIEVTGDAATLRLEGRVLKALVDDVKSACEEHLSKGYRLTLDLGDLSFADRDGIALLRELMQRGVALANCSPFLNQELKQEGLAR
jgi:ABC-type transporter Mla MlaB component